MATEPSQIVLKDAEGREWTLSPLVKKEANQALPTFTPGTVPARVMKSSETEIVIYGPASVEIVDQEGDRIAGKALNKALDQLLRRARFSLQHFDILPGEILPSFKTDDGEEVRTEVRPVTKADLKMFDWLTEKGVKEGDFSLFCVGKVWSDTSFSRETQESILKGELNSFSISGQATAQGTRMESDGFTYKLVNEITGIDLSAVTICKEGMNQAAKFVILKKEFIGKDNGMFGPDDPDATVIDDIDKVGKDCDPQEESATNPVRKCGCDEGCGCEDEKTAPVVRKMTPVDIKLKVLERKLDRLGKAASHIEKVDPNHASRPTGYARRQEAGIKAVAHMPAEQREFQSNISHAAGQARTRVDQRRKPAVAPQPNFGAAEQTGMGHKHGAGEQCPICKMKDLEQQLDRLGKAHWVPDGVSRRTGQPKARNPTTGAVLYGDAAVRALQTQVTPGETEDLQNIAPGKPTDNASRQLQMGQNADTAVGMGAPDNTYDKVPRHVDIDEAPLDADGDSEYDSDQDGYERAAEMWHESGDPDRGEKVVEFDALSDSMSDPDNLGLGQEVIDILESPHYDGSPGDAAMDAQHTFADDDEFGDDEESLRDTETLNAHADAGGDPGDVMDIMNRHGVNLDTYEDVMDDIAMRLAEMGGDYNSPEDLADDWSQIESEMSQAGVEYADWNQNESEAVTYDLLARIANLKGDPSLEKSIKQDFRIWRLNKAMPFSDAVEKPGKLGYPAYPYGSTIYINHNKDGPMKKPENEDLLEYPAGSDRTKDSANDDVATGKRPSGFYAKANTVPSAIAATGENLNNNDWKKAPQMPAASGGTTPGQTVPKPPSPPGGAAKKPAFSGATLAADVATSGSPTTESGAGAKGAVQSMRTGQLPGVRMKDADKGIGCTCNAISSEHAEECPLHNEALPDGDELVQKPKRPTMLHERPGAGEQDHVRDFAQFGKAHIDAQCVECRRINKRYDDINRYFAVMKEALATGTIRSGFLSQRDLLTFRKEYKMLGADSKLLSLIRKEQEN